MVKLYGEPNQLSRKVINDLKMHGKLNISDVEMIMDVACWLKIKIAGRESEREGDMIWIALLVVLQNNSHLDVTNASLAKIWNLSFGFFKQIVKHQRKYRRSLILTVGRKKSEAIIKALSWIQFKGRPNLGVDTQDDFYREEGADGSASARQEQPVVWYNFNTRQFGAFVPEEDQKLITKYFNYLS